MTRRAWMLLVYGSERMYGGNDGYADSVHVQYAYDEFVPNWKQLAAGDLVVLVGKREVIGTAVIGSIERFTGTKARQRCPVCGVAQSKRRVRAKLTYRCNNGHEYAQPRLEQVPCKQFVAHYDDSFATWTGVELSAVRNACEKYNGQMSIQLLNPMLLRELLSQSNPGSDHLSLLPDRNRRYWAAICNPDRYRFDDEYAVHEESTWTLPRGDVRAGDGLIVWMAAGKKKRTRGIVAIGTVLTDPEHLATPPDLRDYWVDGSGTTVSKQAWVRYERLAGLPLLLGGQHDELLLELRVSRSQGSGPFQVTTDQWNRLLEIIGQPERLNHTALQLDFDTSPFSDHEGKRRLVLHYRIERSRQLVDRKTKQALQQTGSLACECCGFDFGETYGPGGDGFCEAHHIHPLHTLTQESISTLDDLAIVCANCHRMLHRIPDCTPDTLRQSLTKLNELER